MTFYQIHIIKKQTLQSFKDVVILNKSVASGTILKSSDLEMGKINTLWYSSDYYTRIEDVVGMYITTDFSKYSILSKQILASTVDDQTVSETDHAMTTLKVLPEAALCFRLAKGDEVFLYQVNPDNEVIDMGRVVIKAIYDNNLEGESLPTYLLIEADQNVIKDIIRFRELGRFEVIRK
ncbi:SAF domain-containing protein [Fusibacter sp. Q10-2]|uniref:SAF domain-containing protein n=2 Tax=Fusibacter ferrireducens TaxID=2785058 RepID=A0ABR9ZYD6_9FIRM|nr:SAF domain-containing protein [Fusibacter ferrireducens]